MFYEKNVDRRNRQSMVDFLKSHFRYSTMNSWNGSTSWANCIKIHRLGLDREQLDRAYEFLETEYWHYLDETIHQFQIDMDFQYTIGINGRSGGYAVVYKSAKEPSGYKSFCTSCGQQNFKTVAESNDICGVCHKPDRVDYQKTHMVLKSWPGQPIGDHDYEDPDEWSMYMLRKEVELVCAFDRACDQMRESFINLIDTCVVKAETTMIPQTRNVIACAG
ncbi:MAG: hypothetical protein OQK82_09345 [Candidatus Pacearchaeota archaeon]|nr:hypothetical protein [Candidatus Pacearchaeota archaeon]